MRKMITALSAAAALLAFGMAAAQASVTRNTPDATPACGAQCFDLSSLVLGTRYIQNAYVAGDHGTGGKVGQDLNMHLASNGRPNEDFTGALVGTLGTYCGNQISSTSYVCVNYPSSYPVFESNWSPFGNESGLCAGVASAGVNNETVTLQVCGASGRTLWVGDLAKSVTVSGSLYTPWVNGADPNLSHPLVLTVVPGTSHPENLLRLERLNLLTGSTVLDTQQFTLTPGPVA
jgi:hypothetical protein